MTKQEEEWAKLAGITKKEPPMATETEFRLRDKKAGTYLTKDELLLGDDESAKEVMIPPVAIFDNEEEAHEARFMYEKIQERQGVEAEVEVVALEIPGGKILYTA